MNNRAHGELDVIYVDGAPRLRNRPSPPKKMSGFYGFCGCGKKVAHLLYNGNMSCNKYSRCSPTEGGKPGLGKSAQAINRIAQIMFDDDKSTDEGLDFALSQIQKIINGLS